MSKCISNFHFSKRQIINFFKEWTITFFYYLNVIEIENILHTLKVSDEDVVEEESDIDDDNGEDIFNDPDFQHMSDSDLDDKLPLFDKNDSDDDDSNLEDEEKESK